MTEHVERIERKVICDRCRKDMTGQELRISQSGRLMREVTTERRFIRKVAMTNGRLSGTPMVYQSNIDFCDTCWWEFDRLFCQGQAIAKSEGVREQRLALMPIPDYLDGRERYMVGGEQ